LSPSIIHRDIKPANIIREERSGKVKLVDFGLARPVSFNLQTMVGTMGFCPPEQLAGRADLRSDLYAVGATLYRMVSGELPRLSFEPLQLNLPGLRPGLDRIITKATHPNADERYASAEEMAQDLRMWQNGVPTVLVPAPPAAPESAPDRRAWAFLTSLALGMGLIGGIVFTHAPDRWKGTEVSLPTPDLEVTADPTLVPEAPLRRELRSALVARKIAKARVSEKRPSPYRYPTGRSHSPHSLPANPVASLQKPESEPQPSYPKAVPSTPRPNLEEPRTPIEFVSAPPTQQPGNQPSTSPAPTNQVATRVSQPVPTVNEGVKQQAPANQPVQAVITAPDPHNSISPAPAPAANPAPPGPPPGPLGPPPGPFLGGRH
jgi:serine/threonine protein kinase